MEAVGMGGSTAYLEYDMACVEALSHHPREALERLESAFKMGFDDFQYIAKDAALDSLRGRADFQVLLRRYSG